MFDKFYRAEVNKDLKVRQRLLSYNQEKIMEKLYYSIDDLSLGY
jgi:hypothetical protein